MSVVVRTVREANISLTGTLVFGSAVVTGLASTADLAIGQAVRGSGVPADTLILTVDSPTQITLTQTVQATGAVALTFLVEPVTLAQARRQITLEIDVDDTVVVRMVGAARRVCETYVKRAFLATTFEASWDAFPVGGGYYNRSMRQFYGAFPSGMGATFPGFLPTNTGIIQLPRPDLISVESITYLDPNGETQTMEPSSYAAQLGVPGRLAPAYGKIWPTTLPQIGAVTVRFVAGYGTDASSVPDDVKTAILLMVAHLYENRGEENVEMPVAVRHMLSSAQWGSYS